MRHRRSLRPLLRCSIRRTDLRSIGPSRLRRRAKHSPGLVRFLLLRSNVPQETSPSAERLLLLDLSERERHELREQLLNAGYEVTIALNHADLCLQLLTCRPHGIIADGDLAGARLVELADLIRNSAPAPVSIVFLCQRRPAGEVHAKVLLKPISFPELLHALRASLAARHDAPLND